MDNKEAIKELSEWLDGCCGGEEIEPTRQALRLAISALQAQEAKAQLSAEGTTSDLISRQASCDYCHEDSDGYVTPLEKNCHAFVRRSPIDGWVLSVKYGAWRKDIPIRFCPICGRELKHG